MLAIDVCTSHLNRKYNQTIGENFTTLSHIISSSTFVIMIRYLPSSRLADVCNCAVAIQIRNFKKND